MKKLLVVMATSIIVSVVQPIAQAQAAYKPGLQKGSKLVGGNASFGFGKYKSDYSDVGVSGSSEMNYNSVSINPSVGFFVINGLAIGLNLDITSVSYKNVTADTKATNTQFTAGPMIRFYAPQGFYFDGGCGFGKLIQTDSSPIAEDKDKSSLGKWHAGFGFAIFLNDFVTIEPSIKYQQSITKFSQNSFENKTTQGQLMVGVGFNIYMHKNNP